MDERLEDVVVVAVVPVTVDAGLDDPVEETGVDVDFDEERVVVTVDDELEGPVEEGLDVGLTADEELDDPVGNVDVDCTEEDWLVVTVVVLEDRVDDRVDVDCIEDENWLVVTVVVMEDLVDGVDVECEEDEVPGWLVVTVVALEDQVEAVCEEDGLVVMVEAELDDPVEEDVPGVDCEEELGLLVTVEEELGCESVLVVDTELEAVEELAVDVG